MRRISLFLLFHLYFIFASAQEDFKKYSIVLKASPEISTFLDKSNVWKGKAINGRGYSYNIAFKYRFSNLASIQCGLEYVLKTYRTPVVSKYEFYWGEVFCFYDYERPHISVPILLLIDIENNKFYYSGGIGINFDSMIKTTETTTYISPPLDKVVRSSEPYGRSGIFGICVTGGFGFVLKRFTIGLQPTYKRILFSNNPGGYFSSIGCPIQLSYRF